MGGHASCCHLELPDMRSPFHLKQVMLVMFADKYWKIRASGRCHLTPCADWRAARGSDSEDEDLAWGKHTSIVTDFGDEVRYTRRNSGQKMPRGSDSEEDVEEEMMFVKHASIVTDNGDEDGLAFAKHSSLVTDYGDEDFYPVGKIPSIAKARFSERITQVYSGHSVHSPISPFSTSGEHTRPRRRSRNCAAPLAKRRYTWASLPVFRWAMRYLRRALLPPAMEGAQPPASWTWCRPTLRKL
ncbi:unnamed protein product [Effrenium voratum]|nr:unnamed protein product [Effrenium voratum]